MAHSTHWWECYLMRMAVCILGTVQVQCLTTDITPTLDDPHTSSHNALTLEVSQIVPSATRREPVPSSEQLHPTPELESAPTPPTTTTTTHHLGHQPLPSSGHHFFPTSIDVAVIPPHHAPTESLVTAETDSELSETFTTELSDILIQGTHISSEMYSQKMLSRNVNSQDMYSQEMRSHITPSQVMYSHITDSHEIHSHATDSYVKHSQVTDSYVKHSQVTDSHILHSQVTDSHVTDSHVLHSQVTDSHVTHSQVTDSNIMSSHDIHKIRSMRNENTHNYEMHSHFIHSHIMHSRNVYSNDIHQSSMQKIHSSPEIHELDAHSTQVDISPSHQLIESTPSLPTASPTRYTATSVPASFHTPLMSLLMASSTLPSFPEASVRWQGLLRNNNHQRPSSTNTSDDSVMLSNAQVFESDNRKLLMLVLRAEDCQKFNKVDFERMLSSLLEKYGFADAVPQVSTAKCYSHLSINLTLNSSVPTLRFLPNVDSKSNVTVDVLNRTFRIVKLEKVDLMLQRPSRHNTTVIAAVTRHESVAYIALGVCFGLIVLACLSICCLKLCCWPTILQPKKRLLKKYPMSGKVDDYVLTPLPRAGPSHLQEPQPQASTSSATESAFKAPPEDLVVKASDTSIVPMVSDPATAVVKDSSGNGDMTERNNVKNVQADVSSGVANPTFERY